MTPPVPDPAGLAPASSGGAPWWRRDLVHPGWIVAKGCLFLVLGVLAVVLAFLWPGKGWGFAAAYALSVWAFCRFYYFAFYVISRYVDPSYMFAGLIGFGVWLWRRRP